MDCKILKGGAAIANYIGVSRAFFYSDILHRSDFPVFKLGTRLRANAEQVDEWIKHQGECREGLH